MASSLHSSLQLCCSFVPRIYARFRLGPAMVFASALGLLILAMNGAPSATAQDVPRDVLALYDGSRQSGPDETRIHKFAEMPLNHLGYRLVYHDIRSALPDPDYSSQLAGAIIWLNAPLENPERYFDWAAQAAARGLRFIVLGSLGAEPSQVRTGSMRAFFDHLGLDITGRWAAARPGHEVVQIDRTAYEFERAVDLATTIFPIVRSTGSATPLLTVRTSRRDGGESSTLATVGDRGGYAALGFELGAVDFEGNISLWLIDPFHFFGTALGGAPRHPVPDTTTVSGRRLYFSHVDGDGWNNRVQFQPHLSQGLHAGEVMLRELIAAYPDLPVTVGLISADLHPTFGGGDHAVRTAKAIYALPQVEVGSHTCTHPFAWHFFAGYDRRAEERFVDKSTSLQWFRSSRSSAASIGIYEKPRLDMRRPFSLQTEVDQALNDVSALAPPGKTAQLYQWSGDTRAFEAIIARTRANGVRNINGGDSRFDARFPSVAYVAPLSRKVGSERQIYAVNSNENTYTGGWTKSDYAFAALSETLARTETPRRLKGINLYYHVYSAEKANGLQAVRDHLDYARAARIAPIAASHYAAIADDFFAVQIREVGAETWSYTARGALQTVRLDAADAKAVDLDRSTGVIGATRHGGSLYIALDRAHETAIVALTDAGVSGAAAVGRRMYLGESRWRIVNLDTSQNCGARFTAQGFGNGDMAWFGFGNGAHTVKVERDGLHLWGGTVEVRAGRLDTSLPSFGIQPVDVEIRCAARGHP